MINDLTNRGILDYRLKDICNEIKYIGNLGAHVKEEEADKADAEQALNFADFLITWLLGKIEGTD